MQPQIWIQQQIQIHSEAGQRKTLQSNAKVWKSTKQDYSVQLVPPRSLTSVTFVCCTLDFVSCHPFAPTVKIWIFFSDTTSSCFLTGQLRFREKEIFFSDTNFTFPHRPTSCFIVSISNQQWNIKENHPKLGIEENPLVLAARLKEDLQYNVWWLFHIFDHLF